MQAQAQQERAFVIDSFVNGHTVRLLLDTGAEQSIIDPRVVSEQSLSLLQSATVLTQDDSHRADEVLAVSVSIGGKVLHRVPLIVGDMTALSLAIGKPIDGIAGADLLLPFQIDLDFDEGKAFLRPAAHRVAEGSSIHMQRVGNSFLVPTQVQREQLQLLLDTGTDVSELAGRAWQRVKNFSSDGAIVHGIRSSASGTPSDLACAETITLGRLLISSVPIRVAPVSGQGFFERRGFDGTLGTDVLSKFRVSIDLRRQVLYLRPRKTASVENRYSTIGVQFAKANDGDFTILAVWWPSPAWRAGLQAGQHITAVNGLEARSLSEQEFASQLHGTEGTPVRLSLLSADGIVKETSMTTEELVCSHR